MRALTLPMLFAVALAACSSPFGLDEARRLASARTLWNERAFPDYSFDARHDCSFCRPEEVGPVHITVRGGSVETVTLLETGEAVDPSLWFTIEQLFDRIPLAAKGEGVDDVMAEYDPALGFPSSVRVIYEEGILDAGESYTVTNVGPA